MTTETDVEGDTESSGQGPAAGDDSGRDHDNRRCQATSVMSRISGVRRGRSSASVLDVQPPTYGVVDVQDSILIEVHTALAV